MLSKEKIIIIAVIILVIAAFVGLYFYKSKPNDIGKTVYTAADFPNASTALNQEMIEEKIARLNAHYQDLGKPGYSDYGIWLNIGLLKKSLLDYRGAETAWQKCMSLAEAPMLAAANLADLYFSLEEFNKAEEYFKIALDLNPTNYSLYAGLADIYRYELTDKRNEVETIMNKGTQYDANNIINYYLYLVDFFDKEGNNPAKVAEYIDKIKIYKPSAEVLETLKDYE